jgi:hypothetical protein
MSGWLWVAAPATLVVTRALAVIMIELSRRWANVMVIRAMPRGVIWFESRPDGSLLCYADVSEIPCLLASTGNGLPCHAPTNPSRPRP